MLRSLIMFQTFISRHNSNFYSDKLVLTSVTPATSAPVLQTPKATSSTLYFDSLTVNAGNGGFLHCIQINTSVFFFSSRRRHTRCSRDWSSDVCSSDLSSGMNSQAYFPGKSVSFSTPYVPQSRISLFGV